MYSKISQIRDCLYATVRNCSRTFSRFTLSEDKKDISERWFSSHRSCSSPRLLKCWLHKVGILRIPPPVSWCCSDRENVSLCDVIVSRITVPLKTNFKIDWGNVVRVVNLVCSHKYSVVWNCEWGLLLLAPIHSFRRSQNLAEPSQGSELDPKRFSSVLLVQTRWVLDRVLEY